MANDAPKSKPLRPPHPSAFKSIPRDEGDPHRLKHPEVSSPATRSFLSRLWPFSTHSQAPGTSSEKNAARGAAAAHKVVTEGVLDKRYRGTATRITVGLVALPIAIVTGWELVQRRFMGKNQKGFAISTDDESRKSNVRIEPPTP